VLPHALHHLLRVGDALETELRVDVGLDPSRRQWTATAEELTVQR
jgi:hypothetical protein